MISALPLALSRNKFCSKCRTNGISVPFNLLRLVLERCDLKNVLRPGFWNDTPADTGTFFRLINQTAECTGRPILMVSDPLTFPPEAGVLGEPPADLVDEEGCVTLVVSKGTLVPQRHLSRGTLARSNGRLPSGKRSLACVSAVESEQPGPSPRFSSPPFKNLLPHPMQPSAQQQRVGPHPGGGGPPVGGGPGDDLAARTAHQQQVATFISTQPRCMESGASSLDGNESTVSHLSGMSSATSTPPSMSPPPTQDCVPIAQTVGGDRQAQAPAQGASHQPGGAAGYGWDACSLSTFPPPLGVGVAAASERMRHVQHDQQRPLTMAFQTIAPPTQDIWGAPPAWGQHHVPGMLPAFVPHHFSHQAMAHHQAMGHGLPAAFAQPLPPGMGPSMRWNLPDGGNGDTPNMPTSGAPPRGVPLQGMPQRVPPREHASGQMGLPHGGGGQWSVPLSMLPAHELASSSHMPTSCAPEAQHPVHPPVHPPGHPPGHPPVMLGVSQGFRAHPKTSAPPLIDPWAAQPPASLPAQAQPLPSSHPPPSLQNVVALSWQHAQSYPPKANDCGAPGNATHPVGGAGPFDDTQPIMSEIEAWLSAS